MPSYYENIQGWTDFTDFYTEMLERLPNNAIFVEIGVWKGRSAIFVGEWLKETQKPIDFYAIDNFLGENELTELTAALPKTLEETFEQNVIDAGVFDYIFKVKDDSTAAASRFQDESVHFAYIDAAHYEEAVTRDIEAWWPKIVPGGTLAGHDYAPDCWGVKPAVDAFAAKHGLTVRVTCNVTWVLTKPSAV